MVPAPGRWLPRVSTVDRAWARGAGRGGRCRTASLALRRPPAVSDELVTV